MITVCTGWNAAGYEVYGKRFLDGWKHWPESVALRVFSEDGFTGRTDDLPDCVKRFIFRHPEPMKSGLEPRKGWKEKHVDQGYCFKFDAVKFCRMAMVPLHVEDEVVIWLDGDVITHAEVTLDWLMSIIGPHPVTYLGRSNYHSETGFVAFRSKALRRAWHDLYDTDGVFSLPEWHSAYAFDEARKSLGFHGKNLTMGLRGDVFAQSVLSERMTHLKGKRKFESRTTSDGTRLTTGHIRSVSAPA